jgi:hypothetical protein
MVGLNLVLWIARLSLHCRSCLRSRTAGLQAIVDAGKGDVR